MECDDGDCKRGGEAASSSRQPMSQHSIVSSQFRAIIARDVIDDRMLASAEVKTMLASSALKLGEEGLSPPFQKRGVNQQPHLGYYTSFSRGIAAALLSSVSLTVDNLSKISFQRMLDVTTLSALSTRNILSYRLHHSKI
ncbi:hypothetical protein M422DRAFT_243958 [Sphaerobolus stellatus SS14]|nr:hypothetical protein M422DRAFT_243958 [Sphaerobolus stellatus SS14]